MLRILILQLFDTISAAHDGGGNFKNRKPIGEIPCCNAWMAERTRWRTERWLRLWVSFSLTSSLAPLVFFFNTLQRYVAGWEIKNCMRLWHETHVKAKWFKGLQPLRTFRRWVVEKVHAAVVRRTFRSQHITLAGGAKHWHVEVKMLKAPQGQSTFGSWVLEKVRAAVAWSTFWSHNVNSTSTSERFLKLCCAKCGHFWMFKRDLSLQPQWILHLAMFEGDLLLASNFLSTLRKRKTLQKTSKKTQCFATFLPSGTLDLPSIFSPFSDSSQDYCCICPWVGSFSIDHGNLIATNASSLL